MGLFGKRDKSIFTEKEDKARRGDIIKRLAAYAADWRPHFLDSSTDNDKSSADIALSNLNDAKTYLEFMPYKANPQVKPYAERIVAALNELDKHYKSLIGKEKVLSSAQTIADAALGWAKL